MDGKHKNSKWLAQGGSGPWQRLFRMTDVSMSTALQLAEHQQAAQQDGCCFTHRSGFGARHGSG